TRSSGAWARRRTPSSSRAPSSGRLCGHRRSRKRPRKPRSDLPALIDVHHLPQELDRLLARALERVAAHDRPERPAIAQSPDLRQDLLGALRLAAGEDDDALAVEAALHHVPRPVGERLPGDVVLLEDLLRFGLIDEISRRLHLDDVRAELAGDLRRVASDVHGGLAFLVGDAFAARI